MFCHTLFHRHSTFWSVRPEVDMNPARVCRLPYTAQFDTAQVHTAQLDTHLFVPSWRAR